MVAVRLIHRETLRQTEHQVSAAPRGTDDAAGELVARSGTGRTSAIAAGPFADTLIEGERLLKEKTMRLAFESATDLARALRRAADAHGKHEEQTGRPDPDWPGWYALWARRPGK